MKVNWNSVYRTIAYNLTRKQKVDLSFTLSCLEQGIIILEKLEKLSAKYKFENIEELETILEKGKINYDK